MRILLLWFSGDYAAASIPAPDTTKDATIGGHCEKPKGMRCDDDAPPNEIRR
jgi:hypothetical protein